MATRPSTSGMVIPGLRGMSLTAFVKSFYHQFSEHAVTERAAQLGYYFLFSLFPFLFFLVTLTAYLPLRGAVDDLMAQLDPFVPDQAMALVRQHLNHLLTEQRPHLLTLGLALSLWSASRGVDALRGALNLAYDVKETRPFWRTQGMAIVMTVTLSVLVLASFAVFLLGGDTGLWLAEKIGIGQQFLLVWGWLRWPITALAIMFAVAVTFYFLPDVEQTFKYITPGSVVATLLWLLGTWGFTQYVAHFGNYDATYGSIGGVIVLITWLYLSGLVFVVGGEVNAVIEHASAEGKDQGARAPGEAPPPVEQRPSAAPPGAVKSGAVAERTDARIRPPSQGPEQGPHVH